MQLACATLKPDTMGCDVAEWSAERLADKSTCMLLVHGQVPLQARLACTSALISVDSVC